MFRRSAMFYGLTALCLTLAASAIAQQGRSRFMKDITFSAQAHELQKIDIFLPEEGKGNGACIYFIHGGGWKAGDKKDWHPVMKHFCDLGYVCTTVNYRLRPEYRLPEMLQDVRLGMSWVKEHADEWGFDPKRMAVYGSSAGGHLAGMLATIAPDDDLGMTPEVNVRDTRPQAVVCMCPVLALERYHPEILPDIIGEEWAADEARIPLASPEGRVNGKEAPFLIVVGAEDTTSPISEQETFKSVFEAKGGSCQIEIIANTSHGAFYGVTSQSQKDALPYVEAFLQKTLLKPQK